MFKAKTSILRAPLTYVMTLMLLHVQISEALLTPRPPGASVQHCGRALQLTFGKPLAPNLLRTKEFTTNRDKGRVELTGKEDGDAREHFYTCHWKTNHDFNGHRPYCRTCVLSYQLRASVPDVKFARSTIALAVLWSSQLPYTDPVFQKRNGIAKVSIAVGGGAYRGAIFAAGIMNAMDGRNASSVQAGTGGLLQIADYITGLSGSAWLVVSWLRTKYWSKILDQVIQKGLAGFPISLVDLWGAFSATIFLSGVDKSSSNSLVATFRKDLASHFQDLSSFQASRTTLSPTPLSPLSHSAGRILEIFPIPQRRLNSRFRRLGTNDFLQRTDQDLELVDGEVTPYAPLLVGPRRVEVIFAIDGKNDAENYATGSSVIQTAKRVAQLPKAYKFPQVPLNISTYVTEGLASRPTFFGCDEPVDVPLIIWIANSPPIDRSAGVTNTSTVQLSVEP
ncbi:hypothetical protein KEM48_000138 [Puccinia striiformis f. sp. tritici PST-130]|nr:hypothetical protein KEM48_000138 [Puccinia striiformis f. sp. tritici PST-130]